MMFPNTHAALQCRFYYYQTSLVRPTDQENMDIKMIVCYSKGGHVTSHMATWREAPEWPGDKGKKGKRCTRAFNMVSHPEEQGTRRNRRTEEVG